MSTTAPVIWITLPVAVLVAVAMLVNASLAGLGARSDLDHLAGDVRLANLVVAEGQVLDQLFGVLGRVLHRHHPAGLLAGLCLKDGLVQAGCDVAWQQLLEDGRRAG